MKNGSESVVQVRRVTGIAEYPNSPTVLSLISQWQRKAASLVDDAAGDAVALPLVSSFPNSLIK
jgi:hypothetical protein